MVLSTAVLTSRVAALAALDGVDPGALTGDAAAAWAAELGRARQALDALLAPLAGRIAELSREEAGRFARAKGFTSAPALLSDVAQMPPSDAGRLVQVGSAPQRHAVVARAVADGSLSVEKAAIIRGTLDKMSGETGEIEASLVTRALRRSVPAVRRMCHLELARTDRAALEDRERRNRAARFVRFYDEPDGMVAIRGRLDSISAAHLRTFVDTQVRAQMVTERDEPEGVRRDAGMIAADVLVSMARHCAGCDDPATGVVTTVVVRVDQRDYVRGTGVAQIDGIDSPVPVGDLDRVIVDAAFQRMVMGAGSIVLDMGRSCRLFTKAQRIAIAERDGGCARCGAPPARCDVHHLVPWSRGGATDLRNGLMLCVGCHHRIHEYGWGIEIDAAGRVWFIPPASIDPGRRRQPAHPTRHAA